MKETLNDPDVLLVTEKDGTKPQVVTGLNEEGTPQSVSPEAKNEPAFLKIDKHGNALENFMSNFLNQSKEPTHFHFFRVPLNAVENIAGMLSDMLKTPDDPVHKKFIEEIRILPERSAKRAYQAIDESRIDWSQFEQLGIKKEMIDAKSLDQLLNWQKTPGLLPVKAEIGDSVIRTDARFSFRETPEGKLNLVVHAVRKEPQLDGIVYGIRLSEADKQNLHQTGHAGRLVEIEPEKGQKMQALLSIDKITNELVALRAHQLTVPDQIKGVTLDEIQKKNLLEGKGVYIEGMTAKNGKTFNATVQINADRRALDFSFDNTKQVQHNTQKQNGQNEFRIPTKLLGVELSEQQQQSLKENKTIYVAGMTDRVGEKFNAYIQVNTEKEKLDFFKWNPDRAKKQGAEISADNSSKTQVAVNNEGKTNEATKDIKEPLKQGQTAPTAKQEEKKEVKKARGMKM